jgi:hypothetical protein
VTGKPLELLERTNIDQNGSVEIPYTAQLFDL